MNRFENVISFVLVVVVCFFLGVFAAIVLKGGTSAETIEKAMPTIHEARDPVKINGVN